MKYVDEDETSTKEVDVLAPVVTENEIKIRKYEIKNKIWNP